MPLVKAKVFSTLDLKFGYYHGLGFAIWFEKCLCKISKGDGSGVGKTWFCQMLH
jgi:hypothetical protein